MEVQKEKRTPIPQPQINQEHMNIKELEKGINLIRKPTLSSRGIASIEKQLINLEKKHKQTSFYKNWNEVNCYFEFLNK